MAAGSSRQWLAEAMALHQAGRIDEARVRLRKVLSREPGNFQAVFMAGMLQLQAGDLPGGIGLLQRAAVLNPASPEVHGNLGIALRSAGRNDAALMHLDRALTLAPASSPIQFNRATVLQALGRHDEAVAAYDAVLTHTPEYGEAWYQRGLALHAAGRLADALASYDQATGLADDPELHYNRGIALQALGRHEEARMAYEQATALRPDFPAAHNNLGNLLTEMGDAEGAIGALQRCIDLTPDFAEAHNNLALALAAADRPEEALAHLDTALALDARYAEAYLNRSSVLLTLGRPEEALGSLEQADVLAPDNPKILHNFGIVLHALNRLEEAQASYRRALSLQPDYVEARFHLSLTALLRGDFQTGWDGYELRWDVRGAKPRRHTGNPLKAGMAIANRRILLWCEQGLGDAIQFLRYVPLLAQRGARTILEVPAELYDLTRSLGNIETLVIQGEPLPSFDLQCPLLSLPLVLGTTPIPAAVPYLDAAPERLPAWQPRLAAAGLKVGIVAAGNPKHRNDRNRSVPLDRFRSLIREGIALHLLQKECRPTDADVLQREPAIRDLRPWLTDLSETAAVIACMDLVITVDTSIAHLAGALGKPVWILLPFNPDWRWLLDRRDSPWYPTARLFRQPAPGDWETVFADVRDALADLTAARNQC